LMRAVESNPQLSVRSGIGFPLAAVADCTSGIG
jgi:hypothetical protein